jgi:acyl-CoA dehydrogenase-like protein
MTGDELDIKICRLLTLSFISSAAKCFASDVAMEVTTNAVQLFGGAGYTVDFPVERMMRDAKITQIYEAPIRFSASSWRGHCWRDSSGTCSAESPSVVDYLERLLPQPRMLVVLVDLQASFGFPGYSLRITFER